MVVPLPSLPTDNLYKFVALAGLAGVLTFQVLHTVEDERKFDAVEASMVLGDSIDVLIQRAADTVEGPSDRQHAREPHAGTYRAATSDHRNGGAANCAFAGSHQYA